MTAEGEMFQSPKEAADVIDAGRALALEESLRDAKARPETPPPQGETGPPPPPIVTPEALLKVVQSFNDGVTLIAKKRGKVPELVSLEEARLWANLAAPCMNDLAGAGEIPWLGPVLRWTACTIVTGVVFAPPLMSIMPEPKKAPEEDELTPKDSDVTAVATVR